MKLRLSAFLVALSITAGLLGTGVVSPVTAASNLADPVPDSLIVADDGLEWVWASPCAADGCTVGIMIGKDGFEFATEAQWALFPGIAAFEDKCASAYFDLSHDHCDWINLTGEGTEQAYGSALTGQGPAVFEGASGVMTSFSETFLVRVGETDADDDGVSDETDNCPETANTNQLDTDDDGAGDACDADDDNDGFTDTKEAACGSDPLDAGDTCVPATADRCKNGGWMVLVDSAGNKFKNQGDCVSFVATRGRNPGAVTP